MTDILARQRAIIGTTGEWALNDLIIGDGEIAAERTASGAIKVKVGNGTDAFSDLPYNLASGGVFGEGYTWRNLSASRSLATPYTSPDHPIQVCYITVFSTSAATVALSIGGVQVCISGNGGNGQMMVPISGIVPPNTIYRVDVDGAALSGSQWNELRAD